MTGPMTEPTNQPQPLLASFDAILSDLDGVVYAGPDPIDGAVESLNRAQREGLKVAYVTNNASRSVQTVADHLNDLGLRTDAHHVVSSAQAAAQLARERLGEGAPVQICGAQALADCAREEGLSVVGPRQGARAVLQGFNPEITWHDLAEAAYALADPEVEWIASNTDLTIPKERGIAPGNGTLVAAVATASRREPRVAGKPHAPIFEAIIQRLGVSRPVVIGDRLDTDILGAQAAGLPSIAVMTGVQTLEEILNARTAERPSMVIGTLRELFEDYAQPTVELTGEGDQAKARAEIPGVAVAHADRQTVTVEGSPEDLCAWRAACAAWWAAHPDAPQSTTAEIRWT